MWHSRPPRDPPFMANTILNFHFDYLHTSLRRRPRTPVVYKKCFYSFKQYSLNNYTTQIMEVLLILNIFREFSTMFATADKNRNGRIDFDE